MGDMLRTADETLDMLVDIARERGIAIFGVWPVCVDVEIVRDEPRWYLDGDPCTREQVVQAVEHARAARGKPEVQRRVQVRT